MNFPATRGLVLGAVLATMFNVTSPAMAERSVTRDASDDVVTIDDEFAESAPAPGRPEVDILRTVVRHTKARVSIKIKIADLDRGQFRAAAASVRTSKQDYDAVVFALEEKTTFEFWSPAGSVCHGKRMSYSVKRDLVKMSVPRRCLGNPRWVRVGVLMLSSDGNRLDYGDDAHLDGKVKTAGSDLAYGPRVRRG